MPDVNSPEFWEQNYHRGHDFWDLGRPTPVFERLLESGQYADLVKRLLKSGGTFIALLFPVSNYEGGPPFAVSPDEFILMFKERDFELAHRESSPDSVPQRRGVEELLIFKL